MFCTNCGNKLSDSSKFCNKCGAAVNRKAADSPLGKGNETPIIGNMPAPAAIKVKKSGGKKLALVLSLVFLLIIAGLGGGFFVVKGKTDDFRNYIAESEKKAKSYSSLGEYAGEYSSAVEEANKAADSYNIFKFEEEQKKIDTIFKNVDDLKERVDGYAKKYEDIVKEIEVANKFVFGDYEDKYNDAKKNVARALEDLDEKHSKDGISDLEGLLSDIKNYNEKKIDEYKDKIKEMSSSGDYFSAEKGFIKNAKKELEEALKTTDYIKAEKAFNDFNEQKKRYDGIKKSNYFGKFMQMDVSENKTIKLYYEADGTDWNADKFTLLEKAKGKKTWSRAEIISMNQVQGKLSIDLVADISSSMEHRFYDMKESVKNFANSTDSGTKLGLSIISDVYRRESEFTEDKDRITDLVDDLNCYGLTSLYQSLYSSVVYTASQPGARCVVAFTDGMNVPYGTGYDFSENDVIEVARRYKIPVYMIAIGNEVDGAALRNIAHSTGGEYYENISADSLYDVYNRIYNSQKEIYELTYKSSLSNKKERTVYVNYYDEANSTGYRSEFAIDPDIILSGYSIGDTSNLKSYYTKKKYLSTGDLIGISRVGDIQTIINIYSAKAGYKFTKPKVLNQMKKLGVIKKNGKYKSAEPRLKKNKVIWKNYMTLYNYRYELIYQETYRALSNSVYTNLDEVIRRVHDQIGEKEKGRFSSDVKRAYKALTGF